ncbi:hypothetical protein [Burkholderia vietnamiensis]|uniref:hypothetical protein n=1 Tax=Burkholderia vietnamiensis TaxID=60552 RepID=UPI00265180DF|nr:hypothetical protein [Burkholderia vietnamiensis]MDN7820890.1 hypothetical protein [Burkholderia vietnamiensis]
MMSAVQALCISASVSYRGNLTPDVLVAFLRTGMVADDCRTQLDYAIEEVPPGLWRKALREFGDEEQAQMRRMVHRYAEARRLNLTNEMVAWLR